MGTGVKQEVLTFVFSRCSGLGAHGTAHKHPVAPVDLIYKGTLGHQGMVKSSPYLCTITLSLLVISTPTLS